MSAPSAREWLSELRDLLDGLREEGNDSSVYGSCGVADPRDFSPDVDCSTEEERALHATDCERFARGEPIMTRTRREHVDLGSGASAHIMPSGYGLGVNTILGDPGAADAAERLGRIVGMIDGWFNEQSDEVRADAEEEGI